VIQAKDDIHLWAEEFRGKWEDVFTIRTSIAVKIAKELKTILSPEEIREIEEIPTTNAEAYNYFLKGNYYLGNYSTMEMYEKAIELYERAVELDSAFLLAYVKLVAAHTRLYVPKTWDHTAERLQKARASLTKAIELDPSHPEVHYARGYYLEWIEKDFDQALKEYQLALKDMPNNSYLMQGIGTILLSRWEPAEASEYFIKSHELDPKTNTNTYMVSWSYMLQRNWEEALNWIDRLLSSNPEEHLGYYKKAEIYIYGYGDLDKAREVMEEGSRMIEGLYTAYYLRIIETYARNYPEALEIARSDTWRPHYNYINMGHLYGYLAKNAEAKAAFDSARVMLENKVMESPENAFHLVALAEAYAALGNHSEAIASGNKAIELHPIKSDPWSSGENILLYFAQVKIIMGEYEEAMDHIETLLNNPSSLTVWMLKLDPLFDPIRDHPRFVEIVEGKS
jgi:serine/threonine-protein kinase